MWNQEEELTYHCHFWSNYEGKRSSFRLKQKRLESSSNNNERRWKERRPGDVFVTSRWGHWPQLEHQSAANGLMPAQWHGRLFTTVKCCFGHETGLTWTAQKRRATNKRIHRWKRKTTLWWAELPPPCRAIVLKLIPVTARTSGQESPKPPTLWTLGESSNDGVSAKRRWSGTNEGQIDGGDRCLGRIQGWVMLSMQDAHGRWGCPPPRWITSFCSEALDWQINVNLKQNGSCSRLSGEPKEMTTLALATGYMLKRSREKL